MDEIFEVIGESKPRGFGKAGAAIWIMGLPADMRSRYGEVLAKNFLDMSRAELKAVKYYVKHGTFIGCPEMSPASDGQGGDDHGY